MAEGKSDCCQTKSDNVIMCSTNNLQRWANVRVPWSELSTKVKCSYWCEPDQGSRSRIFLPSIWISSPLHLWAWSRLDTMVCGVMDHKPSWKSIFSDFASTYLLLNAFSATRRFIHYWITLMIAKMQQQAFSTTLLTTATALDDSSSSGDMEEK